MAIKRPLNINKLRTRFNTKIRQEKQFLNNTYNSITIGTIVNTDDKQQMGRMQVFCPSLGDSSDMNLEDLPWSMYASPFGGAVSFGKRGSEESNIDGTTAYGVWAIPSVGSQVLITCIEGNPDYRIWLGSVYGQYLPHTMPHGRYVKNDDDELDGPVASNEKPIEPLYSNMSKAFGGMNSPEWESRGIDKQVSNVDNIRIVETNTTIADILETGYIQNLSLNNYDMKDSSIYSITTPGFHSYSMDDNPSNCRIRLRTTSGHTILMDDTNERVYIATAKGENWIELDQAGNIDMYTSGNFSVHAKKDINLTSDKSIRMYAKEDIHLKAENKIKIQSNSDTNIKSDNDINITAANNMTTHIGADYKLQVEGKLDMLSSGMLNINTNNELSIKSDINLYIESSAIIDITGSQTTRITGDIIHLNGGSVPSTNTIVPIVEQFVESAFVPSKVPEHEPYGRISLKAGLAGNESVYDTNNIIGLGSKISENILELKYNDNNVGKLERGIQIPRGKYWKR